jgi:hypothetical protein
MNNLTKETVGTIIYFNEHEETYIHPYRNRQTRNREIDIFYQYNVGDKKYTGKRMSYLIIFPEMDLQMNKSISVYYNRIFPKYSVLFRGNNVYYFYNVIPLIILEVIRYIIKRKIGFIDDNKSKNEKKDKKIKINNIEEDNMKENDIEMEDIFYDKVNVGEKYLKLLKVYNETDSMFIEMIFKSEQIPFKTEFRKVYKSSSYTFFYILEEDYNDAIIVAEDYKNNKNDKEKMNIEIYKK